MSLNSAGKFGEGTSTTDSRLCPRDSPATDSATDSHLLLPKHENPNLLSPDVQSHRKGQIYFRNDVVHILHYVLV